VTPFRDRVYDYYQWKSTLQSLRYASLLNSYVPENAIPGQL